MLDTVELLGFSRAKLTKNPLMQASTTHKAKVERYKAESHAKARSEA